MNPASWNQQCGQGGQDDGGQQWEETGWNQETQLHVDLFALPLTAHRIWTTTPVVHLHRSARFHSTFSLCYFKWNPTDVRILLKPSFSPSSTTFPPFSPPSLPSFFLVCIPSFPLLAPHPLPLYRTFFATLSVRFGILTGNGDLRNLRLNNFRLF